MQARVGSDLRTLRKGFAGLLAAMLVGPLAAGIGGAVSLSADWRTASRESAGLAPRPSDEPGAIVQIYAARAFNWRGLFGVHTWIATKPEYASAYTVHQVLGWNRWRGLSVVDSRTDLPDRYWYGARPWLVRELRGAEAQAAIAPIETAVKRYPYTDRYRVWPGPNSKHLRRLCRPRRSRAGSRPAWSCDREGLRGRRYSLRAGAERQRLAGFGCGRFRITARPRGRPGSQRPGACFRPRPLATGHHLARRRRVGFTDAP